MNRKEIALYLRIKGEMDENTSLLVDRVYPIAEKTPALFREARYDIFPTEEGVGLSGTDVVLRGNLVKRHFADCRAIYVVLVSMGMQSERAIKAQYAVSPTAGLVLDACYSENIERRLDEYEQKKKENGEKLTSRISCGYGDLPIETQAPLLKRLDADKIGVYENESHMLTPNKSVVALVGVKR